MKKLIVVLAVAAGLAVAGGANAAGPIGGATTNADGSVTLNSTASPFSAGLDLAIPSATNVGDLAALSFNYSFPNGCASGVPKLAIITVRGTVTILLDSVAGFTCAPGTHFLYVLNDATPTDTSQIPGGSATQTWVPAAKGEFDNLGVIAVQIQTTGVNQVMTLSNVVLVVVSAGDSPSM